MSTTLSVTVQMQNLEQARAGLASLGQTATTTGQQLTTAGASGAKFGQQISQGIQPLQTAFSGAQTSMQKFSQETLQTQQSAFRLTGALGEMHQHLPGLSGGLSETGSAMQGLVENTSRFEQGMSSATSETSNFTGALSGIGDSMGQLAGDAQNLGGALSQISADTSSLDNLTSSAEQLTSSFDALRPTAEGIPSIFDAMNSSVTETSGIFAEAGTAAEDFGRSISIINDEIEPVQGGLDSTNTLLDDYSSKVGTATEQTGRFGSSFVKMSGSITALAGLGINLARSLSGISTSQNRVMRANLMAAKSAEGLRKAEVALDNIMKSATSNTNNIANARQQLAIAQEELNELMRAGVTDGAELEAAQQKVAKSAANLVTQLVKGGVAADKATSSVNTLTLKTEQKEVADRRAKDALEAHNIEMANTAATIAGMGGAIVSAIADLSFFKEGFHKLKDAVSRLGPALKAIGPLIAGMGLKGLGALAIGIAGGLAALGGIALAIQTDLGGLKTKLTEIHDAANEAIPPLSPMFDYLGKTFHSNMEGMGDIARQFTDMLGITVPESVDVAAKKVDELAVSQAKLKTGTESVIDPTKGFNSILTTTGSKLSSVGSTTIKVGGAFVQLHGELNDLGHGYSEINGLIIKNSDVLGKSGLSTEKVAEAVNTHTLNVSASGKAIAGVTTELTNESKALTDNLGTYLESNKALEDKIAVQNDVEASARELRIALNEIHIALIDQQNALKADIESYKDLEMQQLRLENAFLTGQKAALEFASGINEAAAEAQGYREGLLSIIGQTEQWADSLGVTNKQLEQLISFSSDVRAKQDDIIDGLADQVHELQVNTRAWESLTEAQKQNVWGLQTLKENLIQLQNPLEATFENIMKLREAYAEGLQAGKDFFTEIGTSREEMAGFRDGMLDTINDIPRFASMLDQLGGAANLSNDELSQLVGVILGAPEAIDALLGEIESLSDELLGMVDFGEQLGESFMPDKASLEKIPKAIRDIMSDELKKGLVTEAAVQEAASMIGPAINFAAGQSLRSQDMSFITDFSTDLAAQLEEDFNGKIPPVMNTLMELLRNPPSNPTQILPWLQRVNIELEKTKQPFANAANNADSLARRYNALSGAARTLAGELKAIGSAAASAASAVGAAVKEGFKTPTVGAGALKGAQQPAAIRPTAEPAKPVNVDTTQAHALITKLQAAINGLKQTTIPPVLVDPRKAYTLLVQTQAAMSGLKQTSIPQVLVDARPAYDLLVKTQAAMSGLKQTTIPVVTVDINPAAAQLQQLVATMSTIGQTAPIPIMVDTQPARTMITGLQALIGSLIGKTIPILVDTGAAGIAIQGLQNQIATMAGKTLLIAVDTGPAGIAIAGLQSQIDNIAGKTIPILVDTQPAQIMMTGLQALIDSTAQRSAPPIQINTSPAMQQAASLQNTIDAIRQKTPPILNVNNTPGRAGVNNLQGAIDRIKQRSPPVLNVNISAGLSNVRRLQSAINSLRGKNVTSTHTTVNRVVNQKVAAQHGFEGVISSPTTFQVAEGGKPEFVYVRPLTARDAANIGENTYETHTLNIPTHNPKEGLRVPSGLSPTSRGGEEKEGPIIVSLNISGNEIVNDKKLTYKINQTAGRGRNKHFR